MTTPGGPYMLEELPVGQASPRLLAVRCVTSAGAAAPTAGACSAEPEVAAPPAAPTLRLREDLVLAVHQREQLRRLARRSPDVPSIRNPAAAARSEGCAAPSSASPAPGR